MPLFLSWVMTLNHRSGDFEDAHGAVEVAIEQFECIPHY